MHYVSLQPTPGPVRRSGRCWCISGTRPPSSTAATKTSRPSIFCACSTREVYGQLSRCSDHGRGVHGLAHGLPPHLRGGLGLRLQVGHGLDARHPGLPTAGTPSTARFHHNNLDLSDALRLGREFVLPLSHDEVVHGKGSLLRKMPGDDWQKFANLRAHVAATCRPARKKLLFMGGSCSGTNGTTKKSLDWYLLDDFPAHQGVKKLGGGFEPGLPNTSLALVN